MSERRRQIVEHHLHLIGEEIGNRWRRPPIRHVHKLDASHHHEQCAGQVHRGADARRAEIDLARIDLGVIDEFFDRVCRHVRIDLHDIRHADEAGDRRHVADKIEWQVLVQAGIDGVGGVDEEHGIAVRRRVRGDFGGEIVAGTGLVLDGELLMQMFGQVLSDQPRADIGRTARRIADQPAHRMTGVLVIGGTRGTGHHHRRASKRQRRDSPS